MLDPEKIIAWLDKNVNDMRGSRKKTFAALVAAAMTRCGVGVLSLGRAMTANTSAKHCIKRTWRFMRNQGVEISAVHKALFAKACRRSGPLVILVDWTDLHPYRTLVMAVAYDGRALPFWSKTIRKSSGKGRMKRAESEAMSFLAEVAIRPQHMVVVADRGFGNSRWINSVAGHNLSFVQRLSKGMTVYNADYYCTLSVLPVGQGTPACCFGRSTLGEANSFSAFLVTIWAADSSEPWYLVTDQKDTPEEVVAIYQKRMWIEAMFRDLKSSKWGLGLDEVRLSEPIRHDRHLLVIFLAYTLLVAFGAVAEKRGLSQNLKANTVKTRVLSLATIGFLTIKHIKCSISSAFRQLLPEPT